MTKAQKLLRRFSELISEEVEASMNWKKDANRDATADSAKGNLSFAGNGKVSVSVARIVKSERVQQQVKAVRELAASQSANKK